MEIKEITKMLFANLVSFLEFLYISDKIGSTFYHVSSLK